MAKRVIELLLRIGIGGFFLAAGAVKIWDFQEMQSATPEFALAVQNYQLTSWDTAVVLAIFLPWLEVVAGLAVIVRRLYLGAIALLAGMLVVFIAALGSAWAGGLDVACGCFGRAQQEANYPMAIGQDLALLAILGLLFWWERQRRRLAPKSEQVTSPQGLQLDDTAERTIP